MRIIKQRAKRRTTEASSLAASASLFANKLIHAQLTFLSPFMFQLQLAIARELELSLAELRDRCMTNIGGAHVKCAYNYAVEISRIRIEVNVLNAV